MYPFYVLGIAHDASDEEVEIAYLAQVEQHPPDRSPEAFGVIREAYEALRDEYSRRIAQLRYFDEDGEGFALPVPRLKSGRRRRLTTAEVAAWLCEGEEP